MLTLIIVCSLFLKCSTVENKADEIILNNLHFSDDVSIFDEDAMSSIVNKTNEKSVGNPDPKVGDRLDLWDPEFSSANPEELGTYYQGDILNPVSDRDRNGIIGDTYRWPKGIVHFRITGKFTPRQLIDISRAMQDIEEYTCIKFKAYSGREKDYVNIASSHSGCWAMLGRFGGEQTLNLQAPKCFKRYGTLIHELLHTLGFNHEQSRTDRDDYISIVWNNIKLSGLTEFSKENTNAFGIPYDYGSVMHYSAFAFSKNNQQTILKKKRGPNIGQRKGLSVRDILKIRAMYKCRGNTSFL